MKLTAAAVAAGMGTLPSADSVTVGGGAGNGMTGRVDRFRKSRAGRSSLDSI